jgi:hypothetical protein
MKGGNPRATGSNSVHTGYRSTPDRRTGSIRQRYKDCFLNTLSYLRTPTLTIISHIYTIRNV